MKGFPRIRVNGSVNFPKQDVGVVAIPIRNLLVSITDTGGASGGFGTAVISGLPAGDWMIMNAVSYLQFSSPAAGIIATYSGTYTIGTAATADATLSGAEIDVVGTAAAVSFGPASSGTTAVTRGQTNSGTTATPTLIDNRAGTKNINLNVTILDASITANSSVRANGVLYLCAAHLGDD